MLIAKKDLQQAAALIEEGKGCVIQSSFKDSIISAKDVKINSLNALVKNTEKERDTYKNDNVLFTDQSTKIKKQKTTIWILLGGLIAAIIL